MLVCEAVGTRSTRSWVGAPATATQVRASTLTSRPPNVTSIAAASSGLPTSRLASRSPQRSAAPDGGEHGPAGAGDDAEEELDPEDPWAPPRRRS